MCVLLQYFRLVLVAFVLVFYIPAVARFSGGLSREVATGCNLIVSACFKYSWQSFLLYGQDGGHISDHVITSMPVIWWSLRIAGNYTALAFITFLCVSHVWVVEALHMCQKLEAKNCVPKRIIFSSVSYAFPTSCN
jgi:hypothetical protein